MSNFLSSKLDIDISAYEKAMVRASDLAVKHAGSIAANFTGAAAKINGAFAGIEGLSKLPGQLNTAKTAAIGLAATGAGILAAYSLVSSSIQQANAQLDRFIKLGANAEKAGVGVEFFQRFSEAALKAKLDVEAIEAALKRAGALVTPKFEQVDTIRQRLNNIFESGYTGSFQSKGLADYNAASTNEQRIRAAVTAMQELRDLVGQTAAIDLAERLFGSETAERIRSGRLDIDAIAASLDRKRDDLVKQEEVERAQEFRERLDAAYKTIDDFLHVSVALEGSGRAVLDVWLGIAEAVAKATVSAGNFYTKIQEMQGPLGDYLSKVGAILGGTAKIFAEGLNDKASGTRTIYDRPIGPEQPGAPANAITPPAGGPPRRPLDWYTDPTSYGRGEEKPKAPASANESLDQVQTYINGLERSTAALKAEMQAIGKSNAERQTSINLAKAEELAKQQGITLSNEQIARIKATSAATAEYRDRLEEVRERQEALRSIGGEVLKGIVSDARSGASAIDIMSNAVGRLTDRLADRTLDGIADMLFGRSGSTGGGLLGGFNLASLFGISPIPHFATGGAISGPGTGTSDSILARVSHGEFVVKASATARHRDILEQINNDRVPRFATGGIVGAVAAPGAAKSGAGASAPNVVTIAPTINLTASGGTPAQNADLADQVGKQLEGAMRGIVASEIRTYMRPGGLLRQ